LVSVLNFSSQFQFSISVLGLSSCPSQISRGVSRGGSNKPPSVLGQFSEHLFKVARRLILGASKASRFARKITAKDDLLHVDTPGGVEEKAA